MTVKIISKGGKVTFMGKALKRDTKIVVNDQLLYEDEFSSLYVNEKNPRNSIIEPPYNPNTLISLVTRNNVLSQCVSAMEVNIDGTGWSIDPMEGLKSPSETDRDTIASFFNEPYPSTTWIEVRRKLRYDMEATGNAYLEVLRNVEGEIVFARYLPCTLMRLVQLDAAVQVEKQITRGKDTFTANAWVRERRYVQKLGTVMLYYREFGASRQLNRNDGTWMGDKVDANLSATEVIHFIVEKDVKTAYGIPRWINQLPSVLGSRKAEEFNLEFFDNGGIPPAAIFIQGGALVNSVAEQVNGWFSGGAKGKHRVAVIEVQSTSGSIDGTAPVSVKTERFGSERGSDSMFQKYDTNCEDHVRVGFRLPPLFLGRAQDYNFATAYTAYMVTEAQVFQPEREEFDQLITTTIVRGLGFTDWKFHSKPLTIKDVETQMKALEMAKDKIKPEDMITHLNDIAGMNFEFDQAMHDESMEIAKGPDPIAVAEAQAGIKQRAAGLKPSKQKKPIKGKVTGKKPQPVRKSDSPVEVVWLVNKWVEALGLEESDMDEDEKEMIIAEVEGLEGTEKELFENVLATKTFSRSNVDPEGLGDLAGCCADLMNGR